MNTTKTINYKGTNYVRLSNNDVSESVDSIIWFKNNIEVLDSELANELEDFYEASLTQSFTPTPNII